jgi:hypothetical protein
MSLWIDNSDEWLLNTDGWANNSYNVLIEEIVCVQDGIQIQNKIFLTENISLIDLNIPKFYVTISENITITENADIKKAILLSPDAGETILEGINPEVLTGSNVIGAVGNAILSGIDGLILMGITIHPPAGEVILSGLAPYLPTDLDISLFNLKPKYLAKKFTTFVEFSLKMPDNTAFLIEKASARLDNETIPIEIVTNGQTENKCRMAIDTNHLKDGYKKLDINIILPDNSNQFRRYVRIL